MTRLLQPATAGELKLPNRIVMAPMTRARAGESRAPNDLMRDYYAQRASKGLIITEATSVRPMGVGYADTPGIWSEEQVAGWKRVTQGVHPAGASSSSSGTWGAYPIRSSSAGSCRSRPARSPPRGRSASPGRHVKGMTRYAAVGMPAEVRDYVERFAELARADEIMTVHPAPAVEGRLRPIELLAAAMSNRSS